MMHPLIYEKTKRFMDIYFSIIILIKSFNTISCKKKIITRKRGFLFIYKTSTTSKRYLNWGNWGNEGRI